MVRFPRVLLVSNCLDISWIYYTDRFEWNRAQLAPFHATLNLSRRDGVKIAKLAIAPEREARLNRPFRHVF